MTKTRATRSDFVQYRHLTTRWQDNDVYGHMNNVVYYELVDSVVNSWLRNEAGMPVPDGDIVGLVVQSGCTYHASLGWPEPIEAGMAVARVGNSSITYLIGLFSVGEDDAAAEASFTHVYVNKDTRRPVPIPDNLRAAATALLREE
ncbi:thioesterase family protein [Ponticaulis sp.]|uniref:acyl-CoA thioesterase n=1 Tax=Ponticaulis sp. TaxID=2020902 RepID=UPI000B722850|nr:thioesterase family protein [Ponticaulis sp.]MAJ08819.1 thioesterase [Ponticaulis sp.]RPG17513.1 MAG: acyl-CoA thioesterase [Hyphomonadaceae bacterium TMED125]HBJ94624.1 thioesterase [Hyphomonadaceae bacterium]